MSDPTRDPPPLSPEQLHELADILGRVYLEASLRRQVVRHDPALGNLLPAEGPPYADYLDDLLAALAGRAATVPFLQHLLRQRDRPRGAWRLLKFVPSSRMQSSSVCPYPGLAAYQSEEHALFFGRERDTDALLESLAASRWLWIDGASGVGKSSLVAAGLLPHLASDGTRWIVARMRPGALPLENLARALFTAVAGQTSITGVLGELAHPVGLRSFIRQHTPADARFLLWVDQLEETRTFADPEQARLLDAAIAGALDDDEPRFHLITTVRIDQVGDVLDGARELGRRINVPWVRRYSLRPLRAGDLEEVIEAPAYIRGRSFQTGLVETIRDHAVALLAESSEGSLPLLAHALRELWLACADRPELDLDGYHRIGGLDGALTQSAEEVLAELARVDPSAPARVQRLLLALATVDGRGRWSRQTIPRARALGLLDGPRAAAELAALSGHNLDTARPLMRIITTSGGVETPRVELIHEALLTRWSTLQKWLTEVEAAKRATGELHDAAVKWANDGRQADGLPGGRARNGHLAAQPGEEDPKLDKEFQEALRVDSANKLRSHKRLRRFRSFVTTVLVGLTVVACVQSCRATSTAKELTAQKDTVGLLLRSTSQQATSLLRLADKVRHTYGDTPLAEDLVDDARSLANVVRVALDTIADGPASVVAPTPDLTSAPEPGSPTPGTPTIQPPTIQPPTTPPPGGATPPTKNASPGEPGNKTADVSPDPVTGEVQPDTTTKLADGATVDEPPAEETPLIAATDRGTEYQEIDCETRLADAEANDLRVTSEPFQAAVDCLSEAFKVPGPPGQRARLNDSTRRLLVLLQPLVHERPDRSTDRLLRRFEKLPVDRSLRIELGGLRHQLPRIPETPVLRRPVTPTGGFDIPPSGPLDRR